MFLGRYSNRYVTACIIPTTSELYVYHFWWLSTWFDSLQPFPSKVNFIFYPFDFLEFHNQNRHTHIANRWNLRHLHKKQVMWQLTTDNYCDFFKMRITSSRKPYIKTPFIIHSYNININKSLKERQRTTSNKLYIGIKYIETYLQVLYRHTRLFLVPPA